MNDKPLVCPNCEVAFTKDDMREYEQHKAVYVLNQHGLSLRAISRLFGWASPEQARVRLNIYKNKEIK